MYIFELLNHLSNYTYLYIQLFLRNSASLILKIIALDILRMQFLRIKHFHFLRFTLVIYRVDGL
jgi:hypothetical protein